MRRIMLCVVWITVACAAVAAEPAEDRVATGKLSLVGKWAITKVHPEGVTKNAHWLLFARDGNYAALDKEGKELWAGTFEIVPSTTPKSWDHRSHDARKSGADQLGIYELNGDALTMACVGGQWNGNEWVGRPRPRAIDPKDADVILELSRAKHAGKLADPSNQRKGSSMTKDLSTLATKFMRAINENDPSGFLAMFDDDTIVDDAGRIIRGRDAIQQWAAHDIFAASVTLDALDMNEYESGVTITAKIDGAFDRNGLPDPLIMTFDIALRDGKIAKLTCRLADR
ncbi:nuclear transport factor 2 family protein [Lacipirellula parvula]|uniref:SnoaL-like domain-containing protein n=1 Tax=Lacipirellula parvula TaxID=2650471 RepID=A0A5K7XGK1_9BACT|nr:nuclear transport factor 2 family protein [Lacipirellula parvula]BBO36024.1 hypothetical protein PLANPX_5636 [Lacipirellula parvula]